MNISGRRRGRAAIAVLPAGLAAAAMAAAALLNGGCGAKLEPLAAQFGSGTPSASQRGPKDIPSDPLSSADQPGALYNNVHVELAPNGPRPGARAGQQPPGNGQDVQRVNSTVQENVAAPGAGAAAAAATRPAGNGATTTAAAMPPPPAATQPAIGRSSGEYYTLGGVVAEVNNTPIYANKVLTLVQPILAAQARELDAEHFRQLADNEIKKQVFELVSAQLEYAAAERNLDSKEKEIADLMTAQWRTQQIAAAGGSLELARAQAAARGENFDELVQDQYRLNMSRLYYQKKVWPRVDVTVNAMREYYQAHRDREFTEPGTARFRLIKVDVRKQGGREQALDKITGARARVVKAGEPFDEVARQINDDPRLLRTGGDLGAPIAEHAFFSDKVEQAVWATPVGQVTDVIDAGDAFYLAKVEDKKPGHVSPFEDEDVQAKIRNLLETEQFRALRWQTQEKLRQDAILRTDQNMFNIAVDMAMQNYPRWSGKAG